jgi:presenilin 1
VCIFRTLLNLLPAFGDADDTTERSEELLKFGALQIINLLAPVTICMSVVLTFVLSVELKVDPTAASGGLTSLPFSNENTDDGGKQFLEALANVAVIITIVVVMTIVLVCLFKFKCYKVIYGWLLIASILLLFVFASLYVLNICRAHNLPLDWFSLSFCMWNFGVMGIIVIHWKGPLRLQQAYLIIICALIAAELLQLLPDWTTWLLLFAISIWDIIAVLCPKGPLRILVETAQERNVELFPALIYSSTMLWTIGMADIPQKKTPSVPSGEVQSSGESNGDTPTPSPPSSDPPPAAQGNHPPILYTDNSRGAPLLDVEGDTHTDGQSPSEETQGTSQQEQPDDSPDQPAGPPSSQPSTSQRNVEDSEEDEETERRGVRLGLGDFIFYSLLVGKAAFDSKGDWVIISSCFVSILIGLCMTTILLGMLRRALPALPISIIFGLIFYFTSRYLLSPFALVLAVHQVFL